jgi:hypothetical protein
LIVVRGDGQNSPPLLLAPGDDGVRQTLAVMDELARDRVPKLAAFPMTAAALRLAAFNWLASVTRFQRDPRGVELLRHPTWIVLGIRTRRKPIGIDCDERAMMVCAEALRHELPCALRAVGTDPDGPLEHVYALVDGVAVDPQECDAPGLEVKHARSLTLEMTTGEFVTAGPGGTEEPATARRARAAGGRGGAR